MTKFKNMVKNLAKNGDDIIRDLTPDSVHMLHAAIGVSGEVAELVEAVTNKDTVNVLEELGDIEFYLEMIKPPHVIFTLKDSDDPKVVINEQPEDLVIGAGLLLDVVKKHAIYNEELDIAKLENALNMITYSKSIVRARFGFSLQETIDANVNKLSKRYPNGKYSNKQAQSRADKI